MTPSASAQISERINALPPLPAAIGKLLSLVNEPDADFKEISRTISLDQTLTAQLLRIANSAFYGFPQQIRTVHQATVVLGRYAVRNMALSLATVALRNEMKDDWPLHPEAFWRHSIAVACGARTLARRTGKVDADEAFVGGLLHDIGKIVLVEHDPEQYRSLLAEADAAVRPLHVIEREAFGVDHSTVGKMLCSKWNIPSFLGNAVAAHHGAFRREGTDVATQQLADLIHTADTFAKVAGLGEGGNPLIVPFNLTGTGCIDVPEEDVADVLQALPGEVSLNEQLFFNTEPGAAENAADVHDKPAVLVRVGDDELRRLMRFSLLSLPCRVCPAEAPDDAAAVVADAAMNADDRAAFHHHGIPVLDVDVWKRAYAPSDWINARSLRAWLSKPLTTPSMSHEPA